MSDNTVLAVGAGGDTIATDDIGGVKYQRVKVNYGSDGSATDVDATHGLPISSGVAATDIAKAEDAAHSSGDVGIMALAVRNDSGAVLAGSDGDYHPITVDATGAVRVDLNGTVSTNNSSTATLLAAATFTGTSDDCLNYNELRVMVIASHASATDGLSLEQSSDNSNWDITDTYTIPATTGKTYSVPRQARYFRVRYTNGGTNQSSFRLQTILNRLGAQSSSQRPGDAYTNETDLEQQQNFLMGFNGTTWDRLRATIANGLAVDVTRVAGNVAVTLAAGAAAIAKAEDVASADADVGVPALAVRKATPANTSGTDGDYEFLQMSAGRLWASATIDAALPAGANAIGKLAANSGVDIGDVDVTTVGTITPGTAATSLGKAEDAAHTTGDVGVMALAVRTDTLASSSGTTADYSAINTNRDGALWVVGAAGPQGGWSIATGTIAATKTDIGTANTAGQVGGWFVYNPNATVAYVQFFNAQASAVTLGTTAPVYSLGIPATSAANVAPGMVGLAHATAISIAVTTTRAGSTGTGSTVDYNIWFKQ